jgi:valyl-tRNA synthetase
MQSSESRQQQQQQEFAPSQGSWKGFFAQTKSWDKSFESGLMDDWERIGLGSFDPRSDKQFFVIDTPPPYPSGRPWHIGGASHYAQIDMIARSARMQGFEVLFPLGIDRNGLPVEIYTEKKYKISMRNTPREKFLELCRVALDDLEEEMIQTLRRMGYSCDYKNKYRTDDPSYRKLTQTTFIEQWKQGRIYKGKRPSNYCWDCGTTIADAEVEYGEITTRLVYFNMKLSDGEGSENIPVASTRPELLCSCQAVIVNPSDERYLHFVGRKAILPIYKREVPIIANPAARPEFGSGAVMVCSYGDYGDVLLFRELGLTEIIAIDLDGRMTKEAGPELCGLKVEEAREKMINMLKETGSLEKIESIKHRTPMCERSKTPIEIIPLDEYYLKVVDVKDELRQIARSLAFFPEMHRSILLNWIDVALDWPISRRRFYGTEIPVWYCENCSEPLLPEPGRYYQPWKEPPPGNPICSKCGGKSFIGDTRTFDTWMDSSVSALFITKYSEDDEFFQKTYPTSLRPQGKDIVRTWLHYSILRCWQLTGKVPWRYVRISGLGLDESRQKMSKSKGNVMDPLTILERYGAESFRLWIASEVSVGSDYVCSEERIASTGKFLSKLWNIARFISLYPIPKEPLSFDRLMPSDKWILGELSQLVSDCLDGYKGFNFFVPANRIRDFAWNIFASHYIELAKGRAYGTPFSHEETLSAWFTLHECLKTILLLLAPICPFITEAIWRGIYSQSTIHKELFPSPNIWSKEFVKYGKELVEFNSLVWNEKKARKLSLKDPISIKIPENLRLFEPDLKVMHKIS